MIDIFFHDKTGVVSGFPGQIDGFEHADGNGEIHYYRLFDGVGIMLLRLEMEAYTEIRTQIGRLEVNFCVNGRFETSFSMRDRVLLKPGDMAVSCYDGFHGSSSASCFPLSYYEGMSGDRTGRRGKLDKAERTCVFSGFCRMEAKSSGL